MFQKSMADIPVFSISQLASTYHFSCNKLIQLSSRKRPAKDGKTNRLTEAHFARGERFETALKNSLNNVKDHTDTSVTAARVVLQSCQPGDCLYQLRLQVPSSWYDELGISESYRIRNFIPDFIFVYGDHRHRRLRVIDAKAAKGTTISHQVTMTTFFLLKII